MRAALRVCLVVSFLAVLVSNGAAEEAAYRFTVIADVKTELAGQPIEELGVFPTINALGNVAFTAIRRADPAWQGVFIGDGQRVLKLADTKDTFGDQTPFGFFGLAPVVNAKREVAFWAGRMSEVGLPVVASGIFRAVEGKSPQRVADSTSPVPAERNGQSLSSPLIFKSFGAYPSINERGETVLWASYQDAAGLLQRGVFTAAREGLAIRVDTASSAGKSLVWVEGPLQTDRGDLAFWGEQSGQVRGVFRCTEGATSDVPKPVVDSSRVDESGLAFDYFAGLSVNQAGDLCFRAFLDLDPADQWNRRRQALCVAGADGKPSRKVVVAGGADDPFLFLGYPSLNTGGLIAFSATENTYHDFAPDGPRTRRQGIYVIDSQGRLCTVVRTGDQPAPLQSPIRYVSIAWHHALNANGEIAFWTELADGSQAILRASLRP